MISTEDERRKRFQQDLEEARREFRKRQKELLLGPPSKDALRSAKNAHQQRVVELIKRYREEEEAAAGEAE